MMRLWISETHVSERLVSEIEGCTTNDEPKRRQNPNENSGNEVSEQTSGYEVTNSVGEARTPSADAGRPLKRCENLRRTQHWSIALDAEQLPEKQIH
jgi:hypothetical protein